MDRLTYILMEYIKGDLLFDFVRELGGIGETRAKVFMSQMLQVLLYLKDQNVAHRDLKLENIMMSDSMEVKVADFGFAKNASVERLLSYRGTKTYMAPEIKEGKVYSGLQADIFSTGVILFSVVTGIFPFKEASLQDKYFCLLKDKKYSDYWATIEKHSKIHMSTEFKNLIQGMLAYSPDTRISVEQLELHPWVQATFDEQQSKKSINRLI